MMTFTKQLRTWLLVVALCLAGAASAFADHRVYDESAYQRYRELTRERAAELCDIWFAAYRPGTVGQTYLKFADQCEAIDLSGCSPTLRSFIHQAKRKNVSIGELFGQGTTPDLSIVIFTLRAVGAKSTAESPTSSDRGRRILEMMRELEELELEVVRQLRLDQ